jgi:acetyl-CoA carboxylase biotin carboxylase subunit
MGLGYTISPFYDSMMGKVIVHGNTREEAINKMKATLDELVIDGINNNRQFCFKILENRDYIKGDFNTGFIPKYIDTLLGYEDYE